MFAESTASSSSYRIASSGSSARISIWPFYVNLMRKDSCIYGQAGLYLPNILIREGRIKYLLGGLRVRKGGAPILCCREDLRWKEREEEVGFFYECVSLPQGATILRHLAVVRV